MKDKGLKSKNAVSIILAAVLTAGLISGCADIASASGMEAEGISLETIAELNGTDVSELNTVFDENGNLSFIADKLSEDTIQDADEAYDFVVEKLSALLPLDNISLAAADSYTSPNTGITYYRFEQTLPAEIETELPDGTTGTMNVDVEYLTGSLKLGVDTNGFPVVLASDLSYDEPEFDADTMRSPEDAEDVVTTAHPDVTIYPDATALTFWKDYTVKSETYDASAAAVYLVYADNPDHKEDSACSPYICYVVRADGDRIFDSDDIIAGLAADSLSDYSDIAGENVSLSYFDDMEDVGEYTYTVSLDWMSENDRTYSEAYLGTDCIEITVPVMRSKTDGLYYLGWKEHNISMSNALDFYQAKGDRSKLNPYVTDDPEDLDSWHFKRSENEKLSCSYADDPDYVLASFAEYVKIIDTFGNNFGMYESYPDDSYLLLTYQYDLLEQMGMDTDAYPTELADFSYNAANGSNWYGWNTFYTSPNCASCLDDVVMGHEFTHGVNLHFTDAQNANEQGAVMEAMADMVGYQLAAVYLEPELAEAEEWLIGGRYSNVIRNLSDPVSMGCPEYIGGEFYVNPVDPSIIHSAYVDRGGIHRNSLIPCYLGTQIVNGTAAAGEETLTVEESLKMWFEVLYLSNYSTDFVNIGADLAFAAKALNLSEEKQMYVNRMIQEYGFADGIVDPQLLESEDSDSITIRLDYEDEAVSEEYYFFDLCTDVLADNNLPCGGFTDNKEQTIRTMKGLDLPQLLIGAQSEQDVLNGSMYQCFMNAEELEDELTFHVKKVDVPSGEAFTLEKTETIANMLTVENSEGEGSIVAYQAEKDDETGITYVSIDHPAPEIIVTKEDGTAEGEYNLYLVEFE